MTNQSNKKSVKIGNYEVVKSIKPVKKTAKSVQRLKNKVASTLEWLDLSDIYEDHMILNKGKVERIVKGYKIHPHNIFLDSSSEQANRIGRLRGLYNSVNFKLYHAFVFNPVNLDIQIAELSRQYEREDDSKIQELILDDIQKMMVFIDMWKELEFYIVIQGKPGKEFDDQFIQLGQELKASRLIYQTLNKVDYDNYAAYLFENTLINDFYFSRGEFNLEMPEIENEVQL